MLIFKNLIKENRDDKLDDLIKVILKWVLRLCYALNHMIIYRQKILTTTSKHSSPFSLGSSSRLC